MNQLDILPMHSSIRYLVSDLDGNMVDNEQYHKAAFEAMLAEDGMQITARHL